MIITPRETQASLWDVQSDMFPSAVQPLSLWAIKFEIHPQTQLPENILAEQVFSLSAFDVERLQISRDALDTWDSLANMCRELGDAKHKILHADHDVLSLLGSALQYYVDTEPESLARTYVPTESNKLDASRRRLRTRVAQDMLSEIAAQDIAIVSLYKPDMASSPTGMYL
jgi:hypothetical protein